MGGRAFVHWPVADEPEVVGGFGESIAFPIQLQHFGGSEPGDARNAWIAGRADDLADTALIGQAGGQGVLARTVPEHQNSHDVNGLIRVQTMLVRGDYFVDLGRGLRLESALTRDSLAYLL